MIIDFACKETAKIFRQEPAKPKVIPLQLQQKTLEILQILDAATTLSDLYFPPSNGFKKIVNTPATYELRVDKRYRIYFDWDGQNATRVHFADHL